MPRRSVTFDSHYNGLPINTANGSCSCNLSILKSLEALLVNYTQAHSQVLVLGYTLSFSPDSGDPTNDSIKFFMYGLCRILDADGYDPGYLWVREQAASQNQHYHLALLINRNKRRGVERLYRIVSECWSNITCSGTVYGTDQMILRRDSQTQLTDIRACFYWLSYWAKTNTKERTERNLRWHSTSHAKTIYRQLPTPVCH